MRTKKETDLRKIQYFSKNKFEPKCFTDDHAKLYVSNPGPAHKTINIVKEWKEYLPPKRGIFLKNKRTTFTEECIRVSKLIPAPSKYPTCKFGDPQHRIIGNYKR